MKLYSELTILKKLGKLHIENPDFFFDNMEPEPEPELQQVNEHSNFMLLDTVTKLVAAKVANYGHCDDDELKDCFLLANKIINSINNKTLPNVEEN